MKKRLLFNQAFLMLEAVIAFTVVCLVVLIMHQLFVQYKQKLVTYEADIILLHEIDDTVVKQQYGEYASFSYQKDKLTISLTKETLLIRKLLVTQGE